MNNPIINFNDFFKCFMPATSFKCSVPENQCGIPIRNPERVVGGVETKEKQVQDLPLLVKTK